MQPKMQNNGLIVALFSFLPSWWAIICPVDAKNSQKNIEFNCDLTFFAAFHCNLTSFAMFFHVWGKLPPVTFFAWVFLPAKMKNKNAGEGDFSTKKLKSEHFSDPKILAYLLEHALITHSLSKNASFFGFRYSLLMNNNLPKNKNMYSPTTQKVTFQKRSRETSMKN